MKSVAFVAPSLGIFLTLWFHAIAESEHYLSLSKVHHYPECLCGGVYCVPL